MPATQPKKVLLLFSRKAVEDQRADPKALVKLLNENGQDVEVYGALFEELLFSIDEQSFEIRDTANDRSLRDYDVMYFRYWGDSQGPAIATARFCKQVGIPFIDSETNRPGSYSKLTQYVNLHEAGIPFPKTLIGPHDLLLKHYADYGFGFPLVIKSTTGTRGQDNYIIHDEAELRAVLNSNPELTFVMQVFIPNEGDYRVVVMGDRVVMVIERRAAAGSHLNNTSQGGAARMIPPEELPAAVLELSIRAATFYGRQVAGVDMVRSTVNGRYYCFEVNRSPQIEHATFEHEKAALLASYLHGLAK